MVVGGRASGDESQLLGGHGLTRRTPAWGVWNDGEHRFAFSCGPRSRKAANLAVNPHVVVTIDDAAAFASRATCWRFTD